MNRRPYTPGSVAVGPFKDYASPRFRSSVELSALYTGLSLPALFLFNANEHLAGSNGAMATAATEGVLGRDCSPQVSGYHYPGNPAFFYYNDNTLRTGRQYRLEQNSTVVWTGPELGLGAGGSFTAPGVVGYYPYPLPFYATSLSSAVFLQARQYVSGAWGSWSTDTSHTPALATNLPKVKANGLNGKKTANFDANRSINFLDSNAITTSGGDITVIAVAKQTLSTQDWFFLEHGYVANDFPGFFCYGAGNAAMTRRQRQTNAPASFTSTTLANWRGVSDTWYTRIFRVDYSATTWSTRLNGVAIAGTSANNYGTEIPVTGNLFIGSRLGNSVWFRGELAMVAIYDGYLSDADCILAEGILRRHFNHYS